MQFQAEGKIRLKHCPEWDKFVLRNHLAIPVCDLTNACLMTRPEHTRMPLLTLCRASYRPTLAVKTVHRVHMG